MRERETSWLACLKQNKQDSLTAGDLRKHIFKVDSGQSHLEYTLFTVPVHTEGNPKCLRVVPFSCVSVSREKNELRADLENYLLGVYCKRAPTSAERAFNYCSSRHRRLSASPPVSCGVIMWLQQDAQLFLKTDLIWLKLSDKSDNPKDGTLKCEHLFSAWSLVLKAKRIRQELDRQKTKTKNISRKTMKRSITSIQVKFIVYHSQKNDLTCVLKVPRQVTSFVETGKLLQTTIPV